MEPIHKQVAGLDVHRMKQVATVLVEEEEGTVTNATLDFIQLALCKPASCDE